MTDYYRNRWRTQAEAIVGEGFATVLGRYPESWDSNWLDLGGDSISAARLVAYLQRTTGTRLRIKDVQTHDSTVAVIAERLTTGGSLDRQSCLSIHRLDRTADDEPVLVYLHHAAGTAYAGHLLAKAIGVTVCSVRAAGLEGERPVPRRIEDFTAVYREQIGEAFGDRTVWTSGFSTGGLLAFELSRQIRANGGRVAGVILIDAVPPLAYLDSGLPDLIRTQQGRLWELLRRSGAAEDLMKEAFSVPAASPTRLAGLPERMVSALVAGAAVPHHEAEEAVLNQLDVWAAMHEAWYAYRATSLPGRLHYLKATESPDAAAQEWATLADDLVMAEIDGEHSDYELFRNPELHTVLDGWLRS